MNLRRAFVSSVNIAALFDHYRVPAEPDYLSIDIDSADLWVLRALLAAGRHRPRVVTVEFNANFPPGSALTAADPAWGGRWAGARWRATCFFGTSAEAVQLVAEEFGYAVVHWVEWADLVLVRADLLGGARLPRFGEEGALAPWRCAWPACPFHPAMTWDEARLLVDYANYSATGDPELAQLAAWEQITRVYPAIPEGACFMNVYRRLWGCDTPPACAAAAAAAAGQQPVVLKRPA